MRTLMHVRRRGGEVIVINPVVETGLVNFSVPSDVRSLLFGTQDRQPVRAAAHRRRPGAADRHRQAHRRDGRRRRRVPRRPLRRLARARKRSCARSRWDEIVAQDRRRARRDRRDRRALRRGQERRLQLDDGHHAPRSTACTTCRRSPTWPCCAAWSAGRSAGLLPIRGHSNVQGIGSIGVTPKLKDAVFERLRIALRRHSCRPTPGLDTMACIEAAAAGRLKFGFCLGGNLYGSNPDADVRRHGARRSSTCSSI